MRIDTVGELRAALDKYPDHMAVRLALPSLDEQEEHGDEAGAYQIADVGVATELGNLWCDDGEEIVQLTVYECI